MSEQFPHASRLSEYFDFERTYRRHDMPAPWKALATASSATADDVEVDYEAIPTRDEMDADPECGPAISLIDEPHAIALPEVYEPGYAYPLIVWFHSNGATEDELFDALPMISERNYLAVALRGSLPQEDGARWSTSMGGTLEVTRRVEEIVRGMQQKFNVNPQRVYLAGIGAGGTTALEVMLERPEAFAGAACLCGEFPTVDKPLARFRGLRGRRLLLSTTYSCPDVKVIDLVNSGRMLYAAGMQVGTRIYQQSGDAAKEKMLRDIDHWIMGSIETAMLA